MPTVSGFHYYDTTATSNNLVDSVDTENIFICDNDNTNSLTTQANAQHYLNRSSLLKTVCLFKYYQLYYYRTTG